MTKDSRLARPARGLALFAAAALAAGAAPANSQQAVTPPTQAQCQTEWDDSGASDTCGAGVVSPTYGSLDAATVTVWTERKWIYEDGDERSYIAAAGCRVQVQCMSGERGVDADQTVRDDKGVDNDWSGSLDGTSDLNNCNGTLQVGSC